MLTCRSLVCEPGIHIGLGLQPREGFPVELCAQGRGPEGEHVCSLPLKLEMAHRAIFPGQSMDLSCGV